MTLLNDEPNQTKILNEPAPIIRRGRRKINTSAIITVLPDNSKENMLERELENKIINLYGKGLTTRDITSHLKSVYGVDLSTASISGITDKVFPLIKEWQARPLGSLYPLLYLDGL